MWIFHSMLDRVGARADNMREFPFDTSLTDKELYFTGYGKGLKTGAKFTALVQVHTLFANSTPNKFQTSANFILATASYTDKAGEASQPSGMVKFKFAAAAWGGTCCKTGTTCADGGDSVSACNLDTGGSLKLFAVNNVKQIAHGYHDKKANAKKYNALTSIKYTKLWDMPATCTTLRGRGGLGSANQKLADVFWAMTSNIASSPSLQVYMHVYVTVKSANAKPDADMNVIYGFPLNTFSATANTGKLSQINGAVALATGLKIYIAATKVPLADYYGFYVTRMTPFFKATGGNEIDVMVNTARAVKCWSWGSYNGAGFAEVHTFIGKEYWTGKYFAAQQFKGLNMIICKLGVAAGTATTGDVVVVPTTQTAPDGKLGDGTTDVNNPTPKATSTNPLATSWNSMKTACNGKNPAILAGTDEYLGTMTFISNANVAWAGLTQHANLEGSVGNAANPTLPTSITQLNDNTNSQLFDIKPKTDPTTTWLIGAAKLDAILYFKQAAVADWTNVRSVMTVCGPQAGSTLPSDLVITAGNAGTGAACTAAYMYTVGANDWSVVTGYTTRKQRYCRWCSSVAASGNNELHLKDFVPPTTANRKLKGMSIFSATTGGVFNLAKDASETKTLQESVTIGTGGCGKSGQTTKKSTKGQTVEFTMKSPVPLAAGQFVIWQDVTSGGVKNW
jgi:hypothetical protein